MSNMYSNINAERARKNLTVEELSKMLGISKRTYYAWQKNGDIPATKLLKMSEIFGCSIDYLVGHETKTA